MLLWPQFELTNQIPVWASHDFGVYSRRPRLILFQDEKVAFDIEIEMHVLVDFSW